MELEEYNALLESAELTDEQKTILTDEKITGLILPAFKTKLAGAYSETTNKTLTAVDNKIKAETGIEKKPGEQSSEYYVRAAKEVATRESSSLSEQIASLKKEKAGATPEDLKILKDAIAKLEAEKAELTQGHESKIREISFNTRFEKIKDKINFNPLYDSDILDPALERVKADAMKVKTVDVDGVQCVSENGVTPIYVDSKPLTFDDYIRKALSKFEVKTGATGNGGTDSAGKGIVPNPHNIKATTKTAAFEELENTLKASGKHGTQLWDELRLFTASDYYKSLK